jgi:hypothetical protein
MASEAVLRARLIEHGLALRMSRRRKPERWINDQGGYMIVNPYDNTIVAGEGYVLSLDDVEAFIDTQQGERGERFSIET